MISKSNIKRITSLQQKKFRSELGLFIAEGTRLIEEIAKSDYIKVEELYYTSQWQNEIGLHPAIEEKITLNEMKKISSLTTPSSVLAICKIPNPLFSNIDFNNNLVLALDTIQDPGNLGTILRLASWFGVANIVCSNETADAFSPKVIQASMGAIARVKVHYCNLAEKLESLKSTIPVLGSFMNGENIYNIDKTPSGILVMGNEGNGISHNVEKQITKRITIPSFTENNSNVESLNVAMATAVILSELRRKNR
ncbi:MAG TPA: RNA methyltransferase [Tenuifilaceae bacterium]|nr:RNA methyltransferase [Tenuifilaceae bacterium]